MSAKIASALHQVMSAVGYIQKTGNNKFHGYKYASEADLLEKLRPAMLDAGLLLIPSVTGVTPIDEHGNTTVTLEYTLVHKDGDIWPHKIGAAGTGNDKNSKGGVGDKGTYKAMTGANKYLLFKLFQIETGDDPETASEADSRSAPPKRAPAQVPAEPAGAANGATPRMDPPASSNTRQRLMTAMEKAITRAALRQWADLPKVQEAITAMSDKDQAFFSASFKQRWEALPEAQSIISAG